MFNLVIFGAPGSGKGTQSSKLIEKFKLLHLSTGDMLRNEIINNTPLGLEAKKIVDEGKLVPDHIVVDIIKQKINNNPNVKGYLFDGFPRTVNQASALDNLLLDYNTKINLVISLDVTTEELKKRLLKRGETSGRSDDADYGVIEKRIKEYQENTFVVSRYYKKIGNIVFIDGEGEIEEIFNKIDQQIKIVQKEKSSDS